MPLQIRRGLPRLALLASAVLTASVLSAAGPTSAAPSTAQAQAAAAQEVRVITVNIDFGNGAEQVRRDFLKYQGKADVLLFQEAKRVTLKNLVGKNWFVRQSSGDSAQRGSAIAVRRDILRDNPNGGRAASISNFKLIKGHDGYSGQGCTIQARYIAVARLQLANGGVMRAASLHMPPKYCDRVRPQLYDGTAARVVALAQNSSSNLVIGGDWNKNVRSDPRNIGARSGDRIAPRAPAGDIDGFYLGQGLTMKGTATELAGPNTHPKDKSTGHKPVRVVVRVPSA